MLTAFLSHLELCFEIFDKEVLDCVRKLDENLETDSRYLFFPGLIRIENPEQVWENDPNMSYHFGWIIECSQELQFFDPRCLQVLILRLVFSFGLAPATKVQEHIPSLQRFCSVWRNGICWCNDDGITSLLELSDNGKAFILKIRSTQFQLDVLVHQSKIITKVVKTITDFCPNVTTVESVIDSKQIIQHPLPSSSKLTLLSIEDVAAAVVSKKEVVKSLYRAVPIKQLLQFDPYACLDQDTLQCILSEKNIMKEEKISNAFCFHFASQINEDNHHTFLAIFSSQTASSQTSFPIICPKQEVINALQSWRDKTKGTYSYLKVTLDRYSIFTGRNPLVRVCFLRKSVGIIYHHDINQLFKLFFF